jgi:large subunit ribosomal protein L23
MAITDIFKKEDAAAKKASAKSEKATETKVVPKPVKKSGLVGLVIKTPHVTEKASNLSQANQYVFVVAAKSTKQEVAKAISGYYGVTVTGVNVINVPGKKRRRGRGIVVEPGYRKAIVSIKKGQTIEVLPK